ncbi:uncharacterized protein LOC121867778 [Homarus americanus]|uniref:uncharacterized protein LOC121867778 n=1 Tax=Homarus americanus TaxID=6706 RepID=UPI001C441DAA|nr:uncharacterized protein LOC121867778 [Homarus americanus]XP_042223801.1 uncharacterized protein LOC121867778 [Homarus americanus]
MKLIFKPGPGAEIQVECPTIRIEPSKRCFKDRLVTFFGSSFRRGTRRCGRINNYRTTRQGRIKFVFKSDGNIEGRGFLCLVRGVPLPIPTTSTTTIMPGCHSLLDPSTPKTVSMCSDLDPMYSENCNCTECGDRLILKCVFCTKCDFNFFAAHSFTPKLFLEAQFNCSYWMDVRGLFYGAAGQVDGLRFCVDQDITHVDIPFDELSSLRGLYYEDCSINTTRSCTYDPCAPSGDVCTLTKGGGKTPSISDVNYSLTLPSSSDLPLLQELYIAEAIIVLNNATLGFPTLKKLCVNSQDAQVSPCALSGLTSVQQVFVELCQANLDNENFKITSPSLDCLEIVDMCTHSIKKYSISLEAGCNPTKTTVTITTEEDYIKYIPKCPFLTLLKTGCVNVNWNSKTECRSCGFFWAWSLIPSELNCIHSQCHDLLTDTVMPLTTYVNTHALEDSCDYPVVPC